MVYVKRGAHYAGSATTDVHTCGGNNNDKNSEHRARVCSDIVCGDVAVSITYYNWVVMSSNHTR